MSLLLLDALLAGLGVTLVSGPLGCFLTWRRMAYFGATLAHSALLGIALSVFLHLDLRLGILIVAVLVSALLIVLKQQRSLELDSILGIIAHASLAIGLVILNFVDASRVNLLALLFGDILAVNRLDLIWIYLGGMISLLVLYRIWHPLLLIAIDEDLARAEGVDTRLVEFLFFLMMSITVAVAMQIVGLLLIVSLLIIPPSTVRPWVSSPAVMAIAATSVGLISVISGLVFSYLLDAPTGPTIVVMASLLFMFSFMLRRIPEGKRAR